MPVSGLAVGRAWRRVAHGLPGGVMAGGQTRVGDLVLAFALTGAMAVSCFVGGPPELAARLGAVVVAAGLLALARRRTHPLAATGATLVVVISEVVAAPHAGAAPSFLAVMVCCYSLAAYATPRALAAGLVLATAGVAAAQYLSPGQSGYSHSSAITFLTCVLVLGPGVVGGIAGVRNRLGRSLEGSASRLRETSPARIEEALAEDRARIATELDVAVLRGLEDMRAHGAVCGLDDVLALERLARDMLGRIRELLAHLRPVGDSPDSAPAKLPELWERVGRTLAIDDDGVRRVARWAWVPDRWVDVGLGVVAVAYAVGFVAGGSVLGLGVALPFAWARRWPLGTTVVSLGFALLQASHVTSPLGGLTPAGAMVLSPLVIGFRCELGRALVGLGIGLAGTFALALAGRASVGADELFGAWALVAGGWAAGRVLRGGAAALEATAASAFTAGEEHRLRGEEAIRDERRRLGRELHDALAHSMTVVVLQAAAARRVWASDPELAASHASVLRRTVGAALEELRPLVVSLALDDVPGHDLRTLAERARACGLDVHVEDYTEGEAEDGDMYRIVREALTNAARHAPGAAVTVRVTPEAAATRVEVVNDASPYPPQGLTGSGHGLRGMAERAAERGGWCVAEAVTGGGFAVRAHLPRVRQ